MARSTRTPWWQLTPVKAVAVTATGFALGLFYALFLERREPRYSFGGNSTPELDRDPYALLPSFADKLELLFQRMRGRGYDPVLYEGYRPDSSLHGYGAAATIVSQSQGTSDPGFFKALQDESELLDLTWAGKFTDEDHNKTEVWAIPRFLLGEFKALETHASRDMFLRDTYAG